MIQDPKNSNAAPEDLQRPTDHPAHNPQPEIEKSEVAETEGTNERQPDRSTSECEAANEESAAVVTDIPPKKADKKPGFLQIVWKHKVATFCGSGLVFIWLAFAQNLVNAEIACSINFAQPAISDTCGFFGLGDKPKRGERLDWEEITARLSLPSTENCALLQAHIRQYPRGAFAAEADRLVRNPIIEITEWWQPETRRLPAFEAISESGFSNRDAAEADVMARARQRADRQCWGFTQGDVWRVQATEVTDTDFTCEVSGNVHFCSLEATTVCSLQRRVTSEARSCGLEPNS